MLSMFKDRQDYICIKRHVEAAFDGQYWAKDVLSKAFALKCKGEPASLIVIGPKGNKKKSHKLYILMFTKCHPYKTQKVPVKSQWL